MRAMTLGMAKNEQLQIVALTIAGILGMVWALSKIASVHHNIGAHDGWLISFAVFSLVGVGLIVHAAYRAINDTEV